MNMRATKITKAVAALALSVVLVACGAHSLAIDLLEDAAGVKVTAENAGEKDAAVSEGVITVAEGDVIVVSPCLDKGSFHLTITEHDSGAVAYDDIAEGRIMYAIEAEPGTYDVEVSGNGATGWMTVFSESGEDLAAQDESLAEALEDAGVDPSTLSDGE